MLTHQEDIDLDGDESFDSSKISKEEREEGDKLMVEFIRKSMQKKRLLSVLEVTLFN